MLLGARVGLWAFLLAALVYLAWRFESLTLPEGSCSPVRAVAPGERMIFDLRPPALAPGDVLLFRAPLNAGNAGATDDPAGGGEASDAAAGGGSLLLGVLREAPDGLPAGARRALAEGALWIEGDAPDCPARDSRLFGPLDPGAVAGRLVLVL